MQPLKLLVAAGLLTALGAPTARADNAERFGAIRALYGDGLSIRRSGDTVTIDWGELDAATYRRYVTEYYRPFLERISANLDGAQSAYPEGHEISTTAAGRTLIEPLLKERLCQALAGSISDYQANLRANLYCTERALAHARAPTVAFRGTKVSYTAPEGFAGITMDEPIFSGAAVLITVAGPGTLDHFGAWRPVRQLVSTMHYKAPESLQRLASDTRAWADGLSASATRRIAARDRRFLGRRGSVVFTDGPAPGWEPITPLGKRAKPSCSATHAHLYGPKKKGHYDLAVRANGVTCKNLVLSQGFAKHGSIAKLCGAHLRPGDNTIEVAISNNVTTDTGRRRIHVKADRVEARKLYNNRAGKRISSGSITCTR